MSPTWLVGEKLFRDRRDAGRELAAQLRKYRDAKPIVLGLPRGGVPVAYEVARELDAPVDVCVVRKIGAPDEPELGIGAVAEDGALWVNREAMALVGVSSSKLPRLIEAQRAEVEARVKRFRKGAPPLDVRDRIVLVVDDGIATGGTVRAAVETLRARGAGRIVVAVPVGAIRLRRRDRGRRRRGRVSALRASVLRRGPVVRRFRRDHGRRRRRAARLARAPSATRRERKGHERSELARPASPAQRADPGRRSAARGAAHDPARGETKPVGLVLFAHGSGSSRHSPRNQYVAGELQRQGLATLLLDLLDARRGGVDALTGHLRFDIGLLASRLVAATEWARQDERRGSSTSATSARARAPPRRSSEQRSGRSWSMRWSREAAGRISPKAGSVGSRRRRCSSSAERTARWSA